MSNAELAEQKTRTLTGAKVSPAYMAHVVLRTTQKDAMAEWYSKVLGTEPVFENEELVFATFDDEHHRIVIYDIGFETSDVPGLSPVDHIAYTMSSLEDILNCYVRLKREGIEPVWPINHGPSISLYYRDPDGNHIELQADTFPTMAECKAYLAQSPEFKADPIGDEFDADALVERYEAGTPLIELFKRGTLPPPKTEPPRTLGPDRSAAVLKMTRPL